MICPRAELSGEINKKSLSESSNKNIFRHRNQWYFDSVPFMRFSVPIHWIGEGKIIVQK